MGLRKLKQGIIGGLAPVVERANVKKNEDDAHSRRLQYLREQAGLEFEKQKTLDQYSFQRDQAQKEYEFNRNNERKMKILDQAIKETDPTRKLALFSLIEGMDRKNLGIQTQAEIDAANLDAEVKRSEIRRNDRPDAADTRAMQDKVGNLLDSYYAFGTKFYEDGSENPNFDPARAAVIGKQLLGLGYDLGPNPTAFPGKLPSGVKLPRLNLPGVGKPTTVRPLEYPFGRREFSGGGFVETDRTRRATQKAIDKSPTSEQRKNMADATEYLKRNPGFTPTFRKLVHNEIMKGLTTDEAIRNIMGNWPTVLAALEESGAINTVGETPNGAENGAGGAPAGGTNEPDELRRIILEEKKKRGMK